MRALPLHGEIPPPTVPAGVAVGRKGFRPFFLLAGVFACAIVPAWLLVLFGSLRVTTYFDAPTWHAHEMLFGFTVAVIAGFLLTAVGNWTGRETLVGPKLLGLAVIWALGRVVMLLPGAIPRDLVTAVDLAFLPLLAIAIARPLFATNSRRNFVMVGVLTALFAANVFMHLEARGLTAAGSGRHAALVALDVVVFLCVVISGRVVPMFTRNATGQEPIASVRAFEVLAIVTMLLLTLLDVVMPYSRLAAGVAGLTGLAVAARGARWGTRHTLRHPLLWILHAGVAWISIGMFLRASALFGATFPSSLAVHALTVGSVGALTLGMMARVALGHTGRALAPPKAMTAAFLLLTASAIVRVAGPLLSPSAYPHALATSGGLWTAAFAIYLYAYAPILLAPRVDGKPG